MKCPHIGISPYVFSISKQLSIPYLFLSLFICPPLDSGRGTRSRYRPASGTRRRRTPSSPDITARCNKNSSHSQSSVLPWKSTSRGYDPSQIQPASPGHFFSHLYLKHSCILLLNKEEEEENNYSLVYGH